MSAAVNLYGVYQWDIPSESNPEHSYRVTLNQDGTYACGCRGWTMHTPRKDCKHIRWLKKGLSVGQPVDPLVASIERIRNRKGVA